MKHQDIGNKYHHLYNNTPVSPLDLGCKPLKPDPDDDQLDLKLNVETANVSPNDANTLGPNSSLRSPSVSVQTTDNTFDSSDEKCNYQLLSCDIDFHSSAIDPLAIKHEVFKQEYVSDALDIKPHIRDGVAYFTPKSNKTSETFPVKSDGNLDLAPCSSETYKCQELSIQKPNFVLSSVDVGSNHISGLHNEDVLNPTCSATNITYIVQHTLKECFVVLNRCPQLSELSSAFDHGISEQEKIISTSEARRLTCKFCDESYASLNDLYRHLIVHSEKIVGKAKTSSPGDLCQSQAHQQRVLKTSSEALTPCNNLQQNSQTYLGKKHLGTSSKHSKIDYSPSLQYVCHICDKGIRSSWDLKRHENSHINQGNYYCKKCDEPFTTSNKLRDHLQNHIPLMRAYVCHICDKDYQYRHHLNRHAKSHVCQGHYYCKKCDKPFTTSEQLRSHLQVCSLLYCQYVCEICEEDCGTRYKLNCHMKSHKL